MICSYRPEPSLPSVVVVQLSMLTSREVVAMANMYILYVSEDAEPFLPPDVLIFSFRCCWGHPVEVIGDTSDPIF